MRRTNPKNQSGTISSSREPYVYAHLQDRTSAKTMFMFLSEIMRVTAVSHLLDFIDNIFCPSRRVNLGHEFPHPLNESGFYRVRHEASPPRPSFKKMQATPLMDWNDPSKANHQEIVFMLRCNKRCSHQNSIVLPYFLCLSQVLRVMCLWPSSEAAYFDSKMNKINL